MAISTYAELKTAVANWLDDSNLTSRIPEFIVYAESLLAGDPQPQDMTVLPGIRCRAMYKRVTASITTEYFDAPASLLELKDIQLNGNKYTPLKYLTPKQMTDKYQSNSTGEPKHYTIIGDEVQVRPAPDTTYTLEIGGYYRFTAFSDDADTNWLLTNHPFIYLYGALVAASPYLQDPMDWKSEYMILAKTINGTERRGQYGASLSTNVRAATP